LIWLIKHAMYAMMPRTEQLPGIADTDLDGFLRGMRRDADITYWLGLVLGSVIFAFTPVITLGIPLPTFLLPHKLVERHANRLLSHSSYLLRQGVSLVRLSAGMCWGKDDRVRACFALAPYAHDPGTFRQT
jgi:hypothetical protein